ncbi:hypothetical protein LUZ60_005033 [Juncus effusus]|nr:hypothetical protein LUZ60_005033 [Juncus effusus]
MEAFSLLSSVPPLMVAGTQDARLFPSLATTQKPEPGNSSGLELDNFKEKIISHSQYPALLQAFINCHKIGAPQEVVDRLARVSTELELHQRSGNKSSSDPELDQFMEAYCNMLVKYKEELTKPLQEAAEFFKTIESQLSSLCPSDEKHEHVGPSEEDRDASGGNNKTDDQAVDPSMEDRELKDQLLKKYSGYLTSLWKELSKKKKKGKLPKDARQKLLKWWEIHYKWPYPSETEKITLADTTGLDPKQINNWFINQRKRHWKPSEDVQFVIMEGSCPHNAGPAAFYMDGHFVGDTVYQSHFG